MSRIPWEQERIYYILVAGIIFILAIISFYDTQNNKDLIRNNELYLIENLKIKQRPSLEKSNPKSSPEIYMQFEGFDKPFVLCTRKEKCIKENKILNSIRVGDIVSIKVLEENYFDKKTFNNQTNAIYSLIYYGEELIDLNCRNENERKAGISIYIIFFILAPLTFILGLRKNKFLNLYLFKMDPLILLLSIGLILYLILRN